MKNINIHPASLSRAASFFPALFIGLVSLAIGLSFSHYYWDDPFIVSVYARNLISGHGLVFNAGERVLGTTTPLYTMVVGLAGLFCSDIPTASCVISAIATAFLGVFIYFGLKEKNRWLPGFICAALVIFSANSYMYVGIETYFYSMLVYGSFCFFSKGKHAWAALMVALAVLARPDGILAVFLLFAFYIFKERRFPVRHFLLFLLVTLPWVIFAYCYYGDVIPQTFYAKKGSISSLQYFKDYVMAGIGGWIFSRNQQLLPFPAFILPVIGFIFGARRSSFLRLSYLYAAAMVAGYTIIASEDPWHSYPVMVAAFLALGYGIYQVATWIAAPFRRHVKLRLAVTVLVAAALSLPVYIWQFSDLDAIRDGYSKSWLGGPRHRAYVRTAEWLNNNAAPGSTVLTLEPGTIAYYSTCIFYDYWGLISRKGWKVSWREAPLELKPDYIIWNNAERGDSYPVPDGYVLRYIVEAKPFPKIFISQRGGNHAD